MPLSDATGVPTGHKRIAYWVVAGLAGAVGGSVAWWALNRYDPIGKAQLLKDFGSVL